MIEFHISDDLRLNGFAERPAERPFVSLRIVKAAITTNGRGVLGAGSMVQLPSRATPIRDINVDSAVFDRREPRHANGVG